MKHLDENRFLKAPETVFLEHFKALGKPEAKFPEEFEGLDPSWNAALCVLAWPKRHFIQGFSCFVHTGH